MRFILLFFMVFSVVSCKKDVKKQINAEDLLISGSKCVKNADCDTGMCRFGMCAGMLVATRPMDRLRIGLNIRKLCVSRPNLRREVLNRAADFLQVQGSDAIVQGRAAQTIGMLCKGRECKPLTDCLAREKDPLRFYCATGLAMAGDSAAKKVLDEYKNFSPRIRKLADFFKKEAGWKNL